MDKFLFLFFIVFCVTAHYSTSFAEELDDITRRVTAANDNQFPYMVSLQEWSKIHSPNRGHKCGGILVTLQHALTAGRCLLLFNETIGGFVPIDRDEYRVFGGSANLTNDTSANRVRRIANTTVYPEYNMTINMELNNIGIIILGTPFLSTTVARISIGDIGNADFTPCTGMGWQRGTRLMYQPMTAINNTVCRMFIQFVNGTVCAMPPFAMPSASHVCVSEWGSPLVCQGNLAGVFIDWRTSCSGTMTAQLFTRVSNYTTWINSVIALPIPELGPEPSTVPPPTTPTTTPAPGASSVFQPGITFLTAILVAQIIRASVIN
ncbi:hypothetical protein PYW08_010214 [Mythimna loreyi]|uniref:Uncharacterized protein n=1 Tax=Mythimna loreyi TaxID=667449 RepID=A0ACC2Q6I7_9NEOP|nr:hypothetical protein PYW08_010214 [Mythimna loreyi]